MPDRHVLHAIGGRLGVPQLQGPRHMPRKGGTDGVQVDGNDILAVYKATKSAVDKARSGGGPTLIEAITYRMGGHSTSDDPTIYRSAEEVELWKKRDPIVRFTKYLIKKGIISEKENEKFLEQIDAGMTKVIKESEVIPP